MRATQTRLPGVLSIDVEDWFHILDLPSAPKLAEWDRLPSRVEHNFRHLLDICEDGGISVTCFFLGWVAQHYPALVREAFRRGHEIASHGFAHDLVFDIGRDLFLEDIRRARCILEDIVGRAVLGYRAPGFSVNEHTPWFFETLEQAGYRYDSSIFPARRRHGGWNGTALAPYRVGSLIEFPVSVQPICGKCICFFGGGYLRVSPLWLLKRMASQVSASGRPVNFYIHPREIDPEHPRLPMGLLRRFQTYCNLATTQKKLEAVIREHHLVTFADVYFSMQATEIRQYPTLLNVFGTSA